MSSAYGRVGVPSNQGNPFAVPAAMPFGNSGALQALPSFAQPGALNNMLSMPVGMSQSPNMGDLSNLTFQSISMLGTTVSSANSSLVGMIQSLLGGRSATATPPAKTDMTLAAPISNTSKATEKKPAEETKKEETAAPAEAPKDQEKFVSPLDKKFMKKPSSSGDFGDRHPPKAGASSNHKGNDFGTGGAEPQIYAVKSGTIRIKPNNGGAGNTVEIDHGNGLVTKYFHLSKFGKFKNGDKINQGDVLGFVGTTGTSTGNHLHFEVHKDGKATDPWPYLKHLV